MDGTDAEKRLREDAENFEADAENHSAAKRFRMEEQEEQLSQDAIDLADDQELLEEEEQPDDPLFGALAAVQNELDLVRQRGFSHIWYLLHLQLVGNAPIEKKKAGQSRCALIFGRCIPAERTDTQIQHCMF